MAAARLRRSVVSVHRCPIRRTMVRTIDQCSRRFRVHLLLLVGYLGFHLLVLIMPVVFSPLNLPFLHLLGTPPPTPTPTSNYEIAIEEALWGRSKWSRSQLGAKSEGMVGPPLPSQWHWCSLSCSRHAEPDYMLPRYLATGVGPSGHTWLPVGLPACGAAAMLPHLLGPPALMDRGIWPRSGRPVLPGRPRCGRAGVRREIHRYNTTVRGTRRLGRAGVRRDSHR